MANLVSPGVNVSEVDLTTIVPAVSTTRGAIAGLFHWGPVNQKVLISSEEELVNTFGKPTNYNAETFFTAANFLSYGNALYVVRAANTNYGTNATFSAVARRPGTAVDGPNVKLTVKNNDDYYDKLATEPFAANLYYIAKYPGEIGNSLKISVCDSADAYSSKVNLTSVTYVNIYANSSGVGSSSGLVLKTAGANTRFSAGDTVYYYNNGDTSISGLTDGSMYYVTLANSTAIKLSATYGGSNIAYTSTPSTNLRHTIIKAPQTATFAANSSAVDKTNDIINVASASARFSVGDRVIYKCANSTVNLNLTDSSYYYVSFVNTTSLALSATYNGANVDLDSNTTVTDTATITKVQQMALVYGNTSTANATNGVLLVANASSRFTVGNKVFYNVPTNNTAIGGLTSNTSYYVSFVNSTSLALSLVSGGANLQLSEARTTNPGETHNLYLVDGYTAVEGEFKTSTTVAQGKRSVITFKPMFTVGADEAMVYAQTFKNSFARGDLLDVGNNTIGKQTLKVDFFFEPSADGSNAILTVSHSTTKYRLHADYVVNSTSNGTKYIQNISRRWEYSDVIPTAPGRSAHVNAYGNNTANDSMHVVISDESGKFTGSINTVLERFADLSRATDAKTPNGGTLYYKDFINQNSQYVWWANDRDGAASANAKMILSSYNSIPYTSPFFAGNDGLDESTVQLSTLIEGYNEFTNKETSDISLVLQGKPYGGETIETDDGYNVNNFALTNWIIDNISSQRQDCVAFITPDDYIVRTNKGNEADALVAWKNVISDSTYAVIDSGYKYMYDKYNDVYRYVPSNGDVAGLCARTERTNDAWWSPAGFTRGQIKNVIKMRWKPNQADRDLIYKNAINPIVPFPGQGTILYGDKTATLQPSAFDRINVRRLFIVLEKAIATAAQYYLFEFNDENTRSSFRNIVIPYLRDIQARRGITDFLVVCDSTNNTPERIDRNEFWGDIYIKPNRSINFIQLNFVAVRTGVSFSTITGQMGSTITPGIV